MKTIANSLHLTICLHLRFDVSIICMMLMAVIMVGCSGQKGNASEQENKESEQTDERKVYENDVFRVEYPADYAIRQLDMGEKTHEVAFGKSDVSTTISWQAPGTFASTSRDFVTLIVSKETMDMKKTGQYYEIIKEDSLKTIDGHPAHSIISKYVEAGDTMLQCRTGLVITERADILITERCNVSTNPAELKRCIETISKSIKIK